MRKGLAESSSGDYSSGEEGIVDGDEEEEEEEEEDAFDADNSSSPLTRSTAPVAPVSYRSYDRRGLVARQTEILRGIQDALGCGRGAARLLAIHHGWSSSDAVAAYLGPQGATLRSTLGLDTAAVEDELTTPSAGSCLVCFDDDVPVIGLASCEHRFCSPCLEDYVAQAVADRNALLVQCPSKGCTRVLGGSACATLLSGQLRKRFIDQLVRVFVDENRAVRFCPKPSCEFAVELLESSGGNNEGVECGAGHSFCFRCGDRPHAPAPCGQFRVFIARIQGSTEADDVEAMITQSTKPCPHCGQRILKNGGCPHVICGACGYHMCWSCGSRYGDGRRGESAFGHSCGMPRAEEKELHDARDDVHRWLWFSERYRILQSSMRETQKFAESDGVKIDKKVGKDLVFAAAQTIIEARQLLSDSFIALFYRRPAVLRHGDALQIDKDMFEFAIGELERQVSLLSELVEDRKNVPRPSEKEHPEQIHLIWKQWRAQRAAELLADQVRLQTLMRVVKDAMQAVLEAATDR